MKWLGAVMMATTILFLALFVGCSENKDTSSKKVSDAGALQEYTYQLNDEREVTCIVYADGYGGGLSCDWEGAR